MKYYVLDGSITLILKYYRNSLILLRAPFESDVGGFKFCILFETFLRVRGTRMAIFPYTASIQKLQPPNPAHKKINNFL